MRLAEMQLRLEEENRPHEFLPVSAGASALAPRGTDRRLTEERGQLLLELSRTSRDNRRLALREDGPLIAFVLYLHALKQPRHTVQHSSRASCICP